MSLDVWLKYPQSEPGAESGQNGKVYSGNITHNLAPMAEAAGIYQHLWRPDEIGITHAQQLIEPLAVGLAQLQADPAKFKGFNAPNGWGKYENLVALVADYLGACREHPDAEVGVWR